MAHPTPKTALLLIDIQTGLLDPNTSHWGPARSNPSFEANTSALLPLYRSLLSSQTTATHKIIHIQHSSKSVSSPLHASKPGFAISEFVAPLANELVITKQENSAFIRTDLEEVLRRHFGDEGGVLYFLGLTTDHCVSTSMRMAGNLGVANGTGKSGEGKGEVVLIEDATACWRKGEGEEWLDAETVHRAHVESLREFGSVRRTGDVKREWEAWLESAKAGHA